MTSPIGHDAQRHPPDTAAGDIDAAGRAGEKLD
jgi:hypothetical protein